MEKFSQNSIRVCILLFYLILLLSLLLGSFNHIPWINYLALLIMPALAFRSWQVGFFALVFMLPFSTGMDIQWKFFFDAPLMTILLPMDLTLGFLLGISFRKPMSIFNTKDQISKTLLGLLAVLLFSCCLGIWRNLIHTQSIFSSYLLELSLKELRNLGPQGDYYPISQFITFSTFIFLTLSLRSLASPKFLAKLFSAATLTAGCAIHLYAISNKLGFGTSLIIPYRGVHSFFPDVHSYGSFALLTFGLSSYYLVKKEYAKGGIPLSWILSIFGLVASGSRASQLLLLILLIGVLIYKIQQHKHKLRYYIISLLCLSAIIGGLIRFSPHTNQVFLRIWRHKPYQSFQAFNNYMNKRPEQWVAAYHMFKKYPLMGVGLGLSNRYSAFEDFTHSPYLTKIEGQYLHNYLFQQIVDIGAIGFFLFLGLFLYLLYHAIRSREWLYGFIGLSFLLSNILAHSLLVQGLLALFFISFSLTKDRTLPLPSKVWLIALLPLIWIEVKKSSTDLPFAPAYGCHLPKIYEDGHGSGLLKSSMQINSSKVELTLSADHPHIAKKPVVVSVQIKSPGSTTLNKEITLDSNNPMDFQFSLPKSFAGKKAEIELRSSRCFTPHTIGSLHDHRILGTKLISLKS